MKRFFLPLLFFSANSFSQINSEEIVRRVADHIIQTTSFQFVNTKTGEKFASTKGKDTSNNVKAESRYNKWQYVNGVLTVGMLRLSDAVNDPRYRDYSKKNFSFIF